VFRSAVDTWAIKQLFPIMPIHRLEEEPLVRATLADLTCDSDGKIDCFIDPEGGPEGSPSLPLHELRPGEPYLLGLFLSGVYQVLYPPPPHPLFPAPICSLGFFVVFGVF
jgi:arginine decarboxylase